MKKIIVILIAIVLTAVIFKFVSRSSPVNSGVNVSEADLILFWGQGCPHCEKVLQYITDNKLNGKVKIAYKEVYNDAGNQQLMADTVKKCPEIDTSQGMGVPLAFDTKAQKCFYGDQPIIDWFAPMLK
jgi:glutaredoxin